MFDKMKQLMEMQRTMQEMKRKLDATVFEVASSDALVIVRMNGSQEIQQVALSADYQKAGQAQLEKSLKDTYNKAIKRSHELAAAEMKKVTGMNIPGLS